MCTCGLAEKGIVSLCLVAVIPVHCGKLPCIMVQQSVVDCFAMSLLMIYLPVRGHERWDDRLYIMKRKLLFKFNWAYSIPGVNRFWQEKCVITSRCDAIRLHFLRD